jgi:hypothetical protein
MCCSIVPSWKWRYFTLNANDKKLLYYETDTDIAPKGVVDLMHAMVYNGMTSLHLCHAVVLLVLIVGVVA